MKKLPKYKVCRRLGPGVYEKCQTEKFTLLESRRQAQKKRGGRRRRSTSDYGRQLLEKQKVRLTYGMSERQFRRYVDEALASKDRASQHLYELLESRLDNVVYRLGLAPTRRAARQMVSHGHIFVNGSRMKIPSYQVTKKDTVTIRQGSREKGMVLDLAERLKEFQTPEWLTYDIGTHEGRIVQQPVVIDAVALFDLTSVVDFYSK